MNNCSHSGSIIATSTTDITLLPCKTLQIPPSPPPPAAARNKKKQEVTTTSRGNNRREKLDLNDVMYRLYEQFGIRSIMVEGGGQIIHEFLLGSVPPPSSVSSSVSSILDYICVTISPKIIGTTSGYGYSDDTATATADANATGLNNATGGGGGPGKEQEHRYQYQPIQSFDRCIKLGDDCIVFSQIT